MKTYSVVAVDDEAPALRRLEKMVNNHPLLELVGSARNSVEAKTKVLQWSPDILLLDIQLKDATAFDVLREVKDYFDGTVVFVTAYDQYAIKAFEFEAIDYLLKPFTEERFLNAVNRIISRNRKTQLDDLMAWLQKEPIQEKKMIVIPEGVKHYFIEKDKVYYISSEGYYSHLIMKEDRRLIRISLKKLDQLLPDHFIRINKSTIINLYQIKEFLTYRSTIKVIMPDGIEFSVSELYAADFKDIVKRFR